MGFKVSAAHHNDAVAQLAVDALVVELLEDLLEVTWEIHNPVDKAKTTTMERKSDDVQLLGGLKTAGHQPTTLL